MFLHIENLLIDMKFLDNAKVVNFKTYHKLILWQIHNKLD